MFTHRQAILTAALIPLLASSGQLAGQAVATKSISFSADKTSKIEGVGPVRLGYPTCQTDGTILLTTMLDPAHSPNTTLVAVTTAGVTRRYNLDEVKGLKGAGILSVTSNASGTTLLVGAMPDRSAPQSSQYLGHNEFLFRYSLGGNLSAVIPLDSSHNYLKIASLQNGSLAALSIDPSSGATSLSFLDASGQITSTYDISGKLLSADEVTDILQEHPLPGLSDLPFAEQTITASSRVQMTNSGNDAVLLVPTNRPRLFIQHSDGASTVIPLTIPGGLTARTFYWERSLGLAILAFGSAPNSASILQLDANTGRSSGEVTIQGKGLSSISAVCSQNGSYYGLSIDKNGAALLQGLIAQN